MSLPAESVVAASNAWVWVPDNATVVETDEYLLVRYPDYFDHPLELASFRPAGSAGSAVAEVLDRAREFGLPGMRWSVRLDSPAEVAELLEARGATVDVTVDVLALDLRGGVPDLPVKDVELRWQTDLPTARDAQEIGAVVFGGAPPPARRLTQILDNDIASIPAGAGGTVVAYTEGKPVGIGGVTMAEEVARLWGGAVVESARGQGVYRAVLAARLAYGVAHGAAMALVKGRTDTSGPILRRVGFAAYGQERIYRVPL